MIHLIWKGKGWQIALLVFGCSLVAELLTRIITSDETYYQRKPYPLSIALLVASIINFLIVKQLDSDQPNPDQTYRSIFKTDWQQEHSLFFISIRYWPWILLVLSVLNFLLLDEK